MPTYRGGRHEHGQNFLIDRKIITDVLDAVARTAGPIIEIGAGAGALTLPLERSDRTVTAIEIDPKLTARLRAELQRARVIERDFLSYRLPDHPHVIVGNLPFHLTTAILRKLLHAGTWTDAVLIMQWEVARRRADVGGSTMMTAQSSPWYEFALVRRIPASAFRPAPTVAAGLITLTRRAVPLVPHTRRTEYTGFVHAVFTGRGRGLPEIIDRVRPGSRRVVREWSARQRFTRAPLPRDLSPEQWAELFSLTHRY